MLKRLRSPFRLDALLSLALLGAGLAVGWPAKADPLQPPFAATLPSGGVAAKALKKCPPAPMPVISLATNSRYAQNDPTKSAIDPERSATYDAAVKPLRDFQSEVVGWANDAVREPDKADKAGCALLWLEAWAGAGALRSLSTRQSEFNRDQALSALGLAYLQVAAVTPPNQGLKPATVAWFRALAADTVRHYDHEAGEMSRANNHRYFAALGVGAAAIAAQDGALFAWAMSTLDKAACAADPAGALPMEMRRGSRARDYQIFAVGPLVMLAEMAARNGRDPYAACDRGLHRIVDFALRSIGDPSAVEALAGEKQIDLPPPEKRGSRLAWLAPYALRFPDTPAASMLDDIGRPSSTALGGNLAVLFPDDRPGVR